jgi:L-ascorbate metabolism protein UlaG (beta-lactamase superfamily)
MRVIYGAHHPKIVTPLGVKLFLDQEKISGSTDLDWWDKLQLTETISVESVPAQHFSGRGSLDRDATLWCGYVINSAAGKIYFAGDTGYNEVTFKQIGEKFQSLDVSIIPIGAFKPRWFMSPIHIDPNEAVKIHREVNSKLSIASHFGTFPLADDSKDDPIMELEKALRDNDLSDADFIILVEGQSKDIQKSE